MKSVAVAFFFLLALVAVGRVRAGERYRISDADRMAMIEAQRDFFRNSLIVQQQETALAQREAYLRGECEKSGGQYDAGKIECK